MSVKDNPKLKSFLVNALRRASYRWPGRHSAQKKAHVGRNQYVCAMCGPNIFYTRKEVQLDHITPVVDPQKGWEDLDVFAERMFVDEDGFQVICSRHHEEKTAAEGVVRKKTRATKKKKVIKKGGPDDFRQ